MRWLGRTNSPFADGHRDSAARCATRRLVSAPTAGDGPAWLCQHFLAPLGKLTRGDSQDR